MSSEVATTLEERAGRRLGRAAAVVEVIGPATSLAGLAWAVLQPYRMTLLHPRGRTVWELLVEPPLLVVVVGLVFALVIARGLVEDLEAGP